MNRIRYEILKSLNHEQMVELVKWLLTYLTEEEKEQMKI